MKIDVIEKTTAELEALKVETEVGLARMKQQLDTAKARAREDGEYADSDWYVRTKYALRMKGLTHQQILSELARRRKAEKATTGNSVQDRFVDICRRRLDPEFFAELLQEAKEG